MKGRNENAMGPFKISLPRTYDASPERVFRAWTDAESAKVWLAMGGDASIDPRPDGLFYLGMAWNGGIMPHYGRYLRVEAPRLLEFTWVSETTRGKETVVTIELTARGKQTELRLTQEGLPDEESATKHTGGWTHFLDTLVERLLA
ncbi:MAG TPA: SRPBCC domain-containing protein [Rhodanobacteraceae bacterium]|nr:SRPBCC domain-containing protein [Rhodanobacteraceae bacterium]